MWTQKLTRDLCYAPIFAPRLHKKITFLCTHSSFARGHWNSRTENDLLKFSKTLWGYDQWCWPMRSTRVLRIRFLELLAWWPNSAPLRPRDQMTGWLYVDGYLLGLGVSCSDLGQKFQVLYACTKGLYCIKYTVQEGGVVTHYEYITTCSWKWSKLFSWKKPTWYLGMYNFILCNNSLRAHKACFHKYSCWMDAFCEWICGSYYTLESPSANTMDHFY